MTKLYNYFMNFFQNQNNTLYHVDTLNCDVNFSISQSPNYHIPKSYDEESGYPDMCVITIFYDYNHSHTISLKSKMG